MLYLLKFSAKGVIVASQKITEWTFEEILLTKELFKSQIIYSNIKNKHQIGVINNLFNILLEEQQRDSVQYKVIFQLKNKSIMN